MGSGNGHLFQINPEGNGTTRSGSTQEASGFFSERYWNRLCDLGGRDGSRQEEAVASTNLRQGPDREDLAGMEALNAGLPNRHDRDRLPQRMEHLQEDPWSPPSRPGAPLPRSLRVSRAESQSRYQTTLSTTFSASLIRISPERSLGRRVSRMAASMLDSVPLDCWRSNSGEVKS